MVTESLALDDPAFYAGDPYPVYAALRAEGDGVHWFDAADGGFWAVTRHAHVQEVSRDPVRFRSGGGVLFADRSRTTAATDSVIYMDPPGHGRHRKLVSPSMTVRRVGALEPRVRTITVDVLDAIDVRRDEILDVVNDIAAPVPTLVIAELLGVPREDLAMFRRWSDTMIAAATEMTEDGLVQAAELFAYMGEIVEARRIEPRDDLISVLVSGEIDGERLTETDIGMFCMTLLVAGNETTRTLLSNGLLALAEHPDQRRRVLDGSADATTTIEELLRWEAPIQMMCRTANADTTIGDTNIREDDYVVLFYGSANRDEDVFGPTASSLDVGREPNPHLSFGYGEHFCLGAGLARLEGRVVLEEVLRRWPGYALAGDVERLPSLLVRGIERLPIALHP